jgi:hypothetical protein
MEMPIWYQEELRESFFEKDVFTIIQLNKSWYKTLKQIQKELLDRNK